ncbi:MAG: PAS domain S-box protein [Balneolaceae bacterium]
MENIILEQLRQYSKDEASYVQLKDLLEDLLTKQEDTERQLSLLEQATRTDYDSILITDLNLDKPGPKIVYVNEGFTEMTGYTKEEVLGKTPRILQGEKTDRFVLDRLVNRLTHGEAFFGHTINYKKDGSEFVNQWDIHPLTNKEGEVTHWVSYQRDITDRKEPGRMIFDSEIGFENLYEESKKTYVDLDSKGNILSSNNEFRELIGYDAGELGELKIWDLIDTDGQKEVKYLFSDFDPKNTVSKSYVWVFLNKSGERLNLEVNVHYFINNGDNVVRLHLVNHTLRDKVIASLKNKKKHLEDILAHNDEFSLRFVQKNSGEINCKYVSDNFTNVTGHSPEAILKGGVKEVLHKDDIDEADKALKRAFKGEQSTIHCKYKTAEGDFIPTLQSFKPESRGVSNDVKSVKSVVMIEMRKD